MPPELLSDLAADPSAELLADPPEALAHAGSAPQSRVEPRVQPDAHLHAHASHARGQLLYAAHAYRELLAADPVHLPALLGLSLIARQTGQLQPALHMAQAALAAHPTSAFAWANLGDTLLAAAQLNPAPHMAPLRSEDSQNSGARSFKRSRLEGWDSSRPRVPLIPPSRCGTEAKAAFHRALQLDPALVPAHYGLGNIEAIAENYPAALTHFTHALRQRPNSPDIHFATAFAYGKLGNHPAAIAHYRRAAQLRPAFASAWLNLGVELIAAGLASLAPHCYSQALVTATGCDTKISALLNHGHLHRARRQFQLAQNHYLAAHALAAGQPARQAEIAVAFAYLHLEQNRFPQAWQSLRQAHASDPQLQNSEILNAQGILLLAEDAVGVPHISPQIPNLQCGSDAGLIDQAIHAFEQAEAQGHKTAPSNRGNALLRQGRVQQAEAAHQLALERDPCHPGVRYNLALTQLRDGNFAAGWSNYEIRWQFREVHPNPRPFSQPQWQGQPLPAGSILFIHAEQGLGDTIQFVRYLPLVAQRSPDAALILEVQRPLARLLTPRFTPHPCAQILIQGQPLPPFTHHIPLLSLPAIFKTTLQTVPAPIPYLTADPQLTHRRATELPPVPHLPGAPPLTPHPRIGLNWAGNPSYRADRERSTQLQTFQPLFELPNIHWISLQRGFAAAQIYQLPPRLRPHNLSSNDRDLADTAALIASLDLVLSTDTAIAHLAGALGKPLWLLLPWQSDWRWMQHIPTTPWYPQARLFRQYSPGNWPELIARVAAELRLWRP